MRSGANFALRNEPKKRHPDFLDSWEEIANFTGRSVRTVRRWAELYDFPVHQDRLGIRGYASEIDAWMAQPLSFRRPPDFQANRRWNEDLRKDSNDLIEQSQTLREQAQSARNWYNHTRSEIRRRAGA